MQLLVVSKKLITEDAISQDGSKSPINPMNYYMLGKYLGDSFC